MDQATVLLLLRHALTAGAAVLVSRGLLDAGQTETLIGAGLSMISVGWSIVQKWQTHAALKNAAATGEAVMPTLTSPVKAQEIKP